MIGGGDLDEAAERLRERQQQEEEDQEDQQQPQQEQQPELVLVLPTVMRIASPSGQGWVWSADASVDEVVQVLEWRDVEFEGLGKTPGPSTTSGRPGVVLPFDRQKTIQEKHWQKW